MPRIGYNPANVRIKSDAGVTVDKAFLAHLQVAAASAVALDADGVLGLTNLGATAQTITTGLTDPAVPRGLSVVGNVSGVAGNVVITGTNYKGEVITETLALNAATPRLGAKAFRSVTSVVLPVQVHTPVAQVETATAAGTVTTAGRAKCTLTADGMPGSPLHVPFDVELGDGANEIAAALRAALANHAIVDITEYFGISGEGAEVILTAKVPAANDTTLNILIDDGEGVGASEGVTLAATSANTTAGVPYDKVSVGWSDILGLPYLLAHKTVLASYLDNVLESTPATVTVSATAIESNTVKLASALAGSVVDVYLIV